jgi:hypothetical protein
MNVLISVEKNHLHVVELQLLLVADDLLLLVEPARLLRLEVLLGRVRLLLQPLARRPDQLKLLLQLFDFLASILSFLD